MAPTQKSNKKRPAASQAGPTPKKAHLDKAGKGEKKRSRPVTLPVKDVSSASDSDGELAEDEDDAQWVDDVEEDGPGEAADDDMKVDAAPPKDPNGVPRLLIPPSDNFFIDRTTSR